MNKPWEGKHFKQIIENYSGCEPNLCMFNAGIHNAILNLTEALKKDWEQQQENLKFSEEFSEKQIQKHWDKTCAQPAEKEKSGHQGLFDIQLEAALQILKENENVLDRLHSTDKTQKLFHDEKKAESFTSSNWIPIENSKCLENHTGYFVSDGIEVSISYWDTAGFVGCENSFMKKITHFMELPKPPGEE